MVDTNNTSNCSSSRRGAPPAADESSLQMTADNDNSTATLTVDPLTSPPEDIPTTSAISNGNDDKNNNNSRREELQLLKMVSERSTYLQELTSEQDEMIDPIERAVRTIIPIPKQYYWDIVVEDQNENAAKNADDGTNADDATKYEMIPTKIKLWHNTIYTFANIGDWLDRKLAQPIASGLGLYTPRFNYVVNNMSDNDMETSKQIVHDRRTKQHHRDQQEMQEKTLNNDGLEEAGV